MRSSSGRQCTLSRHSGTTSEWSLDKTNAQLLSSESHNIQLSGGSSIKNLEQDKVYKFLGIDEGDGVQHNEMKSKTAKEYY